MGRLGNYVSAYVRKTTSKHVTAHVTRQATSKVAAIIYYYSTMSDPSSINGTYY